MAKERGKSPNWTVSCMDADNICKGKVGAAWNNDDGTISIKLNPFVVLNTIHDLKIKLFPYERLSDAEWAEKRKKQEAASASTPAGKFDDMEDDIPF